MLPTIGMAGTIVIDYGFEDFIGYNGNASPAPGYIFGTKYEGNWPTHMASSHIVSNCSGRTAHSGTYYWHVQFYTGSEDSCIGETPISVNSESNIGGNYEYPTGAKDTTFIPTDIQSNTLTVRLWFRATDNWDLDNRGIDGGGGHKFIRVYGGNGSGDGSSAILKLTNDAEETTPRIVFYHHTSGNIYREVGVNWQDGNWHSFVFRVVRNNDTNSADNVTMTAWVDDWKMEGTGTSVTTTATDFGSAYHHIAFASNWSNEAPDAMIGYDIDDFELWDGEPNPDINPSDNTPGGSSGGGCFMETLF